MGLISREPLTPSSNIHEAAFSGAPLLVAVQLVVLVDDQVIVNGVPIAT